jgi:hypothetical protein
MSTTEDQIASIIMRLNELERRLDLARESPVNPLNSSTPSPADTAAARSLLVPAAQGSFRALDSMIDEFNSPVGDTAIYNERHETEYDVMSSLSLRRDLSKPENPPFGLWWTYTVEEALLWPILGFKGDVNHSLDILLLDNTSDTNSGSDGGGHAIGQGDLAAEAATDPLHDIVLSDRRGLDDGTVVPQLIQSFLENVHSRAPCLEASRLRREAFDVIEHGIGWESSACKVVSSNSSCPIHSALTSTLTLFIASRLRAGRSVKSVGSNRDT